ncbi:MAG TPA: hypothetical protein VFW33_03435, partial [Gemmataceae bacterium]|nr:hypothetical protein [Gemmataceae bacterium]
NFVVAYTYVYAGSDTDVYARRYDAAGNYLALVTIATSTQAEFAPSITMDSFGNFAVALIATLDGNTSTNYGTFLRTYNSSVILQTLQRVA